jgi:hypothetical protein
VPVELVIVADGDQGGAGAAGAVGSAEGASTLVSAVGSDDSGTSSALGCGRVTVAG